MKKEEISEALDKKHLSKKAKMQSWQNRNYRSEVFLKISPN